MRILTDKETRRLLAAADAITNTVAPLERRIAALEAAAGQPAATATEPSLAARVARLEKIEAAARAAGAA
jgi:hypothetical protein